MNTILIGLPYSGKTTVLEALTGQSFSKKEENIGVIKVPDNRLDYLTSIFKPKKTVFAEFSIYDYNFQGQKEGAFDNKLKNIIQKMDLLIIVIRNFDSVLSAEKNDPELEYKKIKEEIIFNDLFSIEKRLERESKEKKNPIELPILIKLQNILNKNKFPSINEFTDQELKLITNYNFLSLKKKLILVNCDEKNISIPDNLLYLLKEDNIPYFSISAPLEIELNSLAENEKLEYLESFGLKEPAKDTFIKEAYKSLGLISFLTVGEDEVRAWPIKNGSNAVEAAEKIHSDIAKGFIRAEVISFEDFKKYGSEAECKKAGLYRLEGKDYIVKDGDIIHFRFNV